MNKEWRVMIISYSHLEKNEQSENTADKIDGEK